MDLFELAMLQLAAAWLSSLALSADILTSFTKFFCMVTSFCCLDQLLEVYYSQAHSALAGDICCSP